MATIKIPLTSFPRQRFRTQLDGLDFIFELNWNEREGAWRYDLRDSDNDLICGNVLMTTGLPMLTWARDERIWPGTLVLIDNVARDPFEPEKDPCLEDLEERYSLLYIEVEV